MKLYKFADLTDNGTPSYHFSLFLGERLTLLRIITDYDPFYYDNDIFSFNFRIAKNKAIPWFIQLDFDLTLFFTLGLQVRVFGENVGIEDL